jgi:ABC-type phosphate/phosphonate transport system permease subunit
MIEAIIQSIEQSWLIYAIIAFWFVYSSSIIWKLYKSKDTNAVNLYVYDAIPTVFTSLGVFGTFWGIFDGLQEFDVNTDITNSIGRLLEGLKTAFLTSIIGISLSLVFGRISESVLDKAKKAAPQNSDSEILALNKIANILSEIKK